MMMMIKIIIITVRYIQLKISKMKRRDLLLLSPFKKTGDVGINILPLSVCFKTTALAVSAVKKETNKQINKEVVESAGGKDRRGEWKIRDYVMRFTFPHNLNTWNEASWRRQHINENITLNMKKNRCHLTSQTRLLNFLKDETCVSLYFVLFHLYNPVRQIVQISHFLAAVPFFWPFYLTISFSYPC